MRNLLGYAKYYIAGCGGYVTHSARRQLGHFNLARGGFREEYFFTEEGAFYVAGRGFNENVLCVAAIKFNVAGIAGYIKAFGCNNVFQVNAARSSGRYE